MQYSNDHVILQAQTICPWPPSLPCRRTLPQPLTLQGPGWTERVGWGSIPLQVQIHQPTGSQWFPRGEPGCCCGEDTRTLPVTLPFPVTLPLPVPLALLGWTQVLGPLERRRPYFWVVIWLFFFFCLFHFGFVIEVQCEIVSAVINLPVSAVCLLIRKDNQPTACFSKHSQCLFIGCRVLASNVHTSIEVFSERCLWGLVYKRICETVQNERCKWLSIFLYEIFCLLTSNGHPFKTVFHECLGCVFYF